MNQRMLEVVEEYLTILWTSGKLNGIYYLLNRQDMAHHMAGHIFRSH